MSNVIEKFYNAFKEGNAEEMVSCYDDNIIFEDPAFGELKGEKAKMMWKMLLSKKEARAEISYSTIIIDNTVTRGTAKWTARYTYGPAKRKVVNHVNATFEIKNNKITRHTDNFNFWKWSMQALGFTGYVLGWSSFMKNKVQGFTNKALEQFINTQA